MVRAWFVPLSGTAYFIIQIIAGLALAAFALIAQSRKWPREKLVGWAFAVCSCYMTVLGPATESITYVLLAPATAWLMTNYWSAGALRWKPRG